MTQFTIIRNLAWLATLLTIFPSSSSACEGACIVSITQAFVSNYTIPVQSVMNSLSDAINHRFFSGTGRVDATRLVGPLYNLYANEAYNRAEMAIFPGFFHGKCQDKNHGVEPTGCPNPDCPVVCGTPGSLVHFYNTLTSIAYNTTLAGLAGTAFLTSGHTYDQLQSAIIRATASHHVAPRKESESTHLHYLHSHRNHHRFHKRAAIFPPRVAEKTPTSIDAELKVLLNEFAEGLELSRQCGGQGIPNCNWKKTMVPFILSFP